MKSTKISFFDRFLSFWVLLCIIAGIAIGRIFPGLPKLLSKMEVAHVSIPIAVLIWLMVFPMMLKIDFGSILHHARQPKGLAVTLVTNWLIKPFTMYFFAYFFFNVVFKAWITPENAREYLAGAVLLGAAPCTAMVFVWSNLVDGNPEYTLMQVALNDLIILLAFAPIVGFLLGLGHVQVPYTTLLWSVVLFVLIPFTFAIVVRAQEIRKKGKEYFEKVFLKKFNGLSIFGLLLTLIIIFSFQGRKILNHPQDILLISVPLIIQTYTIFVVAYLASKFLKLDYSIAAPASLIGASNFFELSAAVAISLFGLESGATLTTVVGVLVEVPVMLSLVSIANYTRHWFEPQKRIV